jgi:cytochrome c-type biogenesis protein CcmH/NrfG
MALLLALSFVGVRAKAVDAPADLLARGRVDDAITALNGSISAQPSSSQSYGLLCRAYF